MQIRKIVLIAFKRIKVFCTEIKMVYAVLNGLNYTWLLVMPRRHSLGKSLVEEHMMTDHIMCSRPAKVRLHSSPVKARFLL